MGYGDKRLGDMTDDELRQTALPVPGKDPDRTAKARRLLAARVRGREVWDALTASRSDPQDAE